MTFYVLSHLHYHLIHSKSRKVAIGRKHVVHRFSFGMKSTEPQFNNLTVWFFPEAYMKYEIWKMDHRFDAEHSGIVFGSENLGEKSQIQKWSERETEWSEAKKHKDTKIKQGKNHHHDDDDKHREIGLSDESKLRLFTVYGFWKGKIFKWECNGRKWPFAPKQLTTIATARTSTRLLAYLLARSIHLLSPCLFLWLAQTVAVVCFVNEIDFRGNCLGLQSAHTHTYFSSIPSRSLCTSFPMVLLTHSHEN